MLPFEAILPLAFVTLLMLAAALHGLAALGHFPRSTRQQALRGVGGSIVLWGSIIVVVGSILVAIAATWWLIPWYAAVIGAGIAILTAPLLLQNFSDEFVDGRNALLCFAALALAFAAALAWMTTH
jgi:hypothetical protein